MVGEEVKTCSHCYTGVWGTGMLLACAPTRVHTQLWTDGLGRKIWCRGQDSLEVSVNEEVVYFGCNWTLRVLGSSWFLMLPQQVWRSLKVSFLESAVMWDPGGEHFHSFVGRSECTLKIGYTVLGSLEGIPWKLAISEGEEEFSHSSVRLTSSAFKNFCRMYVWFSSFFIYLGNIRKRTGRHDMTRIPDTYTKQSVFLPYL